MKILVAQTCGCLVHIKQPHPSPIEVCEIARILREKLNKKRKEQTIVASDYSELKEHYAEALVVHRFVKYTSWVKEDETPPVSEKSG